MTLDAYIREAEPFLVKIFISKKDVFILGDITYKLITIHKQVSIKLFKIKLRLHFSISSLLFYKQKDIILKLYCYSDFATNKVNRTSLIKTVVISFLSN